MAAQATAAPPKAPPPPPPPRPTQQQQKSPAPAGNGATAPASSKQFTVKPAQKSVGQRIVLYGTGGIGKTTLASLAPRPVCFDLDRGAGSTGMPCVDGVQTWSDLRGVLHSNLLDAYSTIVLDSCTELESLAIRHTLENVPHEKGHRVTSIEGYGFGKGYQHVYDTFLQVLSDLDEHARAGRSVVLVCHRVEDFVPNPDGEDYRCYQPGLQQPPKQGRIRDRVKNWCDHLLFVNYDTVVVEGKAKGSGSRTIYPQEMPTFWAKSRTLRNPIPYAEGSTEVWDTLFGGQK